MDEAEPPSCTARSYACLSRVRASRLVGHASGDNLAQATALGLQHVVFHKKSGPKPAAMTPLIMAVRSTRALRADIERGGLSHYICAASGRRTAAGPALTQLKRLRALVDLQPPGGRRGIVHKPAQGHPPFRAGQSLRSRFPTAKPAAAAADTATALTGSPRGRAATATASSAAAPRSPRHCFRTPDGRVRPPAPVTGPSGAAPSTRPRRHVRYEAAGRARAGARGPTPPPGRPRHCDAGRAVPARHLRQRPGPSAIGPCGNRQRSCRIPPKVRVPGHLCERLPRRINGTGTLVRAPGTRGVPPNCRLCHRERSSPGDRPVERLSSLPGPTRTRA